jgi:hypothetical protein
VVPLPQSAFAVHATQPPFKQWDMALGQSLPLRHCTHPGGMGGAPAAEVHFTAFWLASPPPSVTPLLLPPSFRAPLLPLLLPLPLPPLLLPPLFPLLLALPTPELPPLLTPPLPPPVASFFAPPSATFALSPLQFPSSRGRAAAIGASLRSQRGCLGESM